MIRNPTHEPTMPKRIDLTGHRFGLLTVISRAGSDAAGRATWLCACDCGGEKVAKAAELKRGGGRGVRSCGCLQLQQRQAAAKAQCHAYSRANWPRERKTWENMIKRCTDPNDIGYANYGGRGVSVCARWLDSFQAFAEDMGRAPIGGTIDRIKNDLGYCPENCKWSSKKEQANNRRNNRLLTYNGKTQTVSQWADELGIPGRTLYQRLYRGLSTDRVLAHSLL